MKNKLLKTFLLPVFLLAGSVIYAQTVTGTVSDASGPLAGVNILVKGTTTGTQTDFDGNYSIDGGSGVLVFSYVGYITQEVAVNGQSVINVTLEEDVAQLSEVIVTGYSTQTRGEITGAVASVDVGEALKVPVQNAAEALQGRVSGVTVVNNGAPGSTPNVNVRGFGTFTSGTGPLYIIDGVQTQDPSVLNAINPNDIDQMNVLKDGAASIYGARAANGVIIITTKSGSYNAQKTTVSVDIYTGTQSVINDPDMLNAQQLGEVYWQSYANDGASPNHPQYGSGATPVIPSTLQGVPASVNVRPNGTNWWNEITRSAPVTSTSVSISGGTEGSKSFVSFGYLNRDGVLKHTSFNRGNVQVNNEFKIGKVRIGQHLNVAYSKNQFGSGDASEMAVRISPLVPVYDNDGNFAGTYSNSSGLSNAQNPYSLLYRARDNYQKNLRSFGDVYMSLEIIDGLTAKTQLAGSFRSIDQRVFTPLNPETAEPRGFNTLAEQDQTITTWTWTNTLNYRKTFGDHKLNALIGVEAIQNNAKGKQASATDFSSESPDFYLLNGSNHFGPANFDWAYENQNSLYSLFATADYNYASKYFLTASVRYDKSSRFFEDNKDDIFPAVSAGWELSKEDFFPDDIFINRAKLRASYGELGNDNIPINSPGITTYAFNQNNANYVFDSSGSVSPGAFLQQPGNPNLVWERSITQNFGIDLGMFDSKVNASVEFFKITTDGLIARNNNIVSSTAIDSGAPFVNLGEIQNTGIDINLSYYDTFDSGLSFGADLNISSYKNKVNELIDGAPVTGANYSWTGAYTRTEEGNAISEYFGRIVSGFDSNGRWTFEDVNGDGTVNDDDRTFIGNPHPDFTFGLNLNAQYKGWDISAFFNGSVGNDLINRNKVFQDFPLFPNGNRGTRVLDSWTPSNQNATLPALSWSLFGNEINSNSYFVEDGSFVRLKNLQIGYNLPDNVLSDLKMASCRIYLQGTNLFTITDYEGIDPEVAGGGILNLGVDERTYPLSSIYSLGVNVKF